MTLSWPRLRRPRCVDRQAGPWLRKMSATSRAQCATKTTYAGCSLSSGLTTSRKISVATCV
jgi:hypothetical protein